MNPKVSDIVKQAYESFRKYKVSKPIDACTQCCITLEQEHQLVTTPVKQIPYELLYSYQTAAAPTKLDINELKHFVPRLLDLAAQFQFVSHDADIALSRIGRFSKEDWTEEEFKLLEEFSKEFFKECLSVYPIPDQSGTEIGSIIVMLWKANMNISPLLAIWEKTLNKESTLHFSHFITYGVDFDKNKMGNPFADAKLSDLIIQWATSKRVQGIFAKEIESLIMKSEGIEEHNLYDLNWAYEKINTTHNIM